MDRVNSICAVPLALIGNLESMQRWRWPAGTCMLTGLGPAWTRHIGGQRPLNGSKMSPNTTTELHPRASGSDSIVVLNRLAMAKMTESSHSTCPRCRNRFSRLFH